MAFGTRSAFLSARGKGISTCDKSQHAIEQGEQGHEIASFDALIGALHPPESELRMLASLQTYLDESIDKDRRIFAIGGFIGRADEWRELLLDWIDRIHPSKLPNPITAFHMTDCETGGGEFRDELGWSRDSRKELIIDLLEIICRYNVALFGMGVSIKEYETLDHVDPNKRFRLGNSQYHFLLQSVIRDLVKEMDDGSFGGYERVAFFFDRNSPHEFWANHLHKRMQQDDDPRSRRIGPLIFDSKAQMRLLQVGDIGAYESMKAIRNIRYAEGRSRKSFQRLLETNHVWKISAFNEAGLQQMVEEKKQHLLEIGKKWQRVK